MERLSPFALFVAPPLAIAIALLLGSACGVDGQNGVDGRDGFGVDGRDGVDGTDGQDGLPCTVSESESAVTISCPDGSEVVMPKETPVEEGRGVELAPVTVGDVIVRSDADLAAVREAGIETIIGALVIDTGNADLSFDQLRQVTDGVFVTSGVQGGLLRLGALELTPQISVLGARLDGLNANNVRTLERLEFIGSDVERVMMRNLTDVQDDLIIEGGLPSTLIWDLSTVGGTVTLRDLPAATAFAGRDLVVGGLIAEGCPELRALHVELAPVASRVVLVELGLERLPDVSALEEAVEVTLASMPNIDLIDGFDRLRVVDELVIGGFETLAVSGFDALEVSTDELWFGEIEALTLATRFPALETAEDIELDEVAHVVAPSGMFPAVLTLEEFELDVVGFSPGYELDWFASLNFVEYLDIEETSGLASISGFGALTTVEDINIEDNVDLGALNLSALESAEYVEIAGNSALPQCAVDALLAGVVVENISTGENDDDALCE